ncbi:MAG: Y-family DNA polymerase [Candidatus Saccharimonadales bacterium]
MTAPRTTATMPPASYNDKTFALVDCNNFFVSCERLFRPDLEGKPVVVLSSNDGCAVARSNEAKALGIPMGAPAFKFKELFTRHGVVQFSANFELYGDVSSRITDVLTHITPRTEVYSVDESFLDLSELEINDYTKWGNEVRARILHNVGIPVSVGIAPSKTLAKLAAERGKKDEDLHGVLDIHDKLAPDFDNYLARTPVEDIWGIGRRLAPRMRAERIATALDMKHMPLKLAGQLMGVNGKQLVHELNGTSCHTFLPEHNPRKSIMRGRTFGEETNDFGIIEAAVANQTVAAAQRLRRNHSVVTTASVYLATSRHKPGYQQLAATVKFNTPTADSGELARALIDALKAVYQPQLKYYRAFVLLPDLLPDISLQLDLLGNVDHLAAASSKQRMAAVDSLNSRYGTGSVRFAAEKLSQRWQPKHNLRSPGYTSRWDQLPSASLY